MEHVEQTIRELVAEIAKQHHYENCTIQIKSISSGGANYMSDLYFATVFCLNKEDLHLFAKVAVVSEEMRTLAPSGVFDTEYFVYSELAGKFKEIEDKHEVSKEDRYTFCKYYGYRPKLYEEILILENLAAQGFVVYDRMKSVDWYYASKAMESLAKFHALSMAYGEQYPEKIKQLSGKFAEIEAGYDFMIDVAKKMVVKAIEKTKPENKERLKNFFEDEENLQMLHYTKPRRKAVIIHGDYRPSNLMHKKKDDGTLEVIPVDFQIIRPGCILSDLMYFVFSSTDKEFRAKHFDNLTEVYYKQLCHSLRCLDFDPEEIYSREDFEVELQEILPYGLLVSVMLLPIVTVELEDAPDIHSENLFGNMAKTKTSSLYTERLNDIVDDYIRWGII